MDENPNLNRIKVALVERQKTSKWLAEQMEKSDTTVSRWVSNKIQPSVEQLFEIARILNMDVKELLNSNILKYCCPLKVSEQRDIHPQCCCNGIADDFSEGKPLS